MPCTNTACFQGPRRLPPIGPFPCSSLALRPRSGPPLVPPLGRGPPSFRHAFTPNVCALDPRTYRLFAGALKPHAAYRLLQTNRSTSTPPSRPNPVACYDGEPPSDGQQPSVETCWPGLLRPGVAALYSRSHPRGDDRASLRIYPNLLLPDTSCRKPMSRKRWKALARRPRGNPVSLPNGLAEPAVLAVRRALKGRPPHPLAKATVADRTRGAFLRQALRRTRRGAVDLGRLLVPPRTTRRLCDHRRAQP